jgi:hypothetical protein
MRGILGSTSPLALDSLRYLKQRWFFPQALLFVRPTIVVFLQNFLELKLTLQILCCLVPAKILPTYREKLERLGRTPYL